MAATPLDVPMPVRKAGERRLYTWAAVLALLVVFAGFARTYYLKGMFGAPELTTLKHAHGILMTAWFALFLAQARLAATGRLLMHRRMGYAGVVLAACFMIVGRSSASPRRARACRPSRRFPRSSSS